MKQETEELKREHILALDIATHCGYFSVHESGTWNFTEGKRRNGNKQHLALKMCIRDRHTSARSS